MGFLSRAESPYNQHVGVGSSVLTSVSSQYPIALHCANVPGVWVFKVQKQLTWFKSQSFCLLALLCLSPLWEDFHLSERAAADLGWKESLHFCFWLSQPTASGWPRVGPWLSVVPNLGVLDLDVTGSNVESHERNQLPRKCGHTS